jgi:hypothetical protein
MRSEETLRWLVSWAETSPTRFDSESDVALFRFGLTTRERETTAGIAPAVVRAPDSGYGVGSSNGAPKVSEFPNVGGHSVGTAGAMIGMPSTTDCR